MWIFPIGIHRSQYQTNSGYGRNFDANIQGERFVAPFHDDNSIDEILAGLAQAADYPQGWDDDQRLKFPTIQGALAEIRLRLETKLRKRLARHRLTAFALALDLVRQGGLLIELGSYEAASELLWKAHNSVEDGNKAPRRKAIFLVHPDGTVQKV
jgi:hypothetical protein